MAWRRDEIWFDVDVPWFREGSAGDGAAAALQPPFSFALASDPVTAIDIPNGLAASRARRGERRRRRNARRARAAALVIAPATMLPVAGQKLGIGSAGSSVLAEDPPSLVRDAAALGSGSGSGVADARLLQPAARLGQAADAPVQREPQFPAITWGRATSHGLHYAGTLHGGTQLPLEGADWVTWHPVEDRVPNAPRRLYGHERTIRTVVSVLAAYREANPDAPRAVVGDISFRGGGPMEAHVSHQNGLDVDVYYPRLDGKLRAPRTTSQIDRALAQDLLDRFVAAGAQIVFVGYSTGLRGPSDVVEPYPNHEDHMHVRFSAPRD